MNSFTPSEMMEIMSSIETINKFMNKFMILQKSKKLICTLKNFYIPAGCLRDSYIIRSLRLLDRLNIIIAA